VVVSSTQGGQAEVAFSVHTARPDEIGAVEIIFLTAGEACAFAADRSRDFRVQSASVTRFVVGQLGTRHPIAWFVDGHEQRQWFDRQLYPTDGCAGPGNDR